MKGENCAAKLIDWSWNVFLSNNYKGELCFYLFIFLSPVLWSDEVHLGTRLFHRHPSAVFEYWCWATILIALSPPKFHWYLHQFHSDVCKNIHKRNWNIIFFFIFKNFICCYFTRGILLQKAFSKKLWNLVCEFNKLDENWIDVL